jgi:excinuclease ABC subunit C
LEKWLPLGKMQNQVGGVSLLAIPRISSYRDHMRKSLDKTPGKTPDIPPQNDFSDEEAEGVEDFLDPVTMPPVLEEGALARGMAAIRATWETLSTVPGVYRMLNNAGEVLYVGKAKNLKARVGSYARGQAHSERIAMMIGQTAAMEVIVTRTENEALLLEANLIKQLCPRYNVLLRDDKSLSYILIGADHPAAQLTKHRGARSRKGQYFGPFADTGAVNRTINALQRMFLLRVCTDSYYANRTRPCLLYQIKRCSGPCTGEISLEDYEKLVKQAEKFLCGGASAIRETLAAQMREAAEHLDYETAARIRDRLAALAGTSARQGINTRNVEEADIFAIDIQAGQVCIEVFFVRNWQNWGNRAFFPKADPAASREEILASFVAQFYDDKPIPTQILLSHQPEDSDWLIAALREKAARTIIMLCPQRGEKRLLTDNALNNAQQALSRKLSESAAQEALLVRLGEVFSLPFAPRRIEVFDNSHISGTNAVGAMIVAGKAGFLKKHYRTYTIHSTDLTPGDDYAMMREVLHRRFVKMGAPPESWCHPAGSLTAASSFSPASSPDDTRGEVPDWPDLILIDGGKGQLEAVRDVLGKLGLSHAPVIAIAKGQDRDAGRETFYSHGDTPFLMPPRDPALYFVQRLRDEAHRFAIGTHRAKRRRDIHKSPLDEITGIGPARKKALLHHFGTVKALRRASLDDLQKVPGIHAELARKIFDTFKS